MLGMPGGEREKKIKIKQAYSVLKVELAVKLFSILLPPPTEHLWDLSYLECSPCAWTLSRALKHSTCHLCHFDPWVCISWAGQKKKTKQKKTNPKRISLVLPPPPASSPQPLRPRGCRSQHMSRCHRQHPATDFHGHRDLKRAKPNSPNIHHTQPEPDSALDKFHLDPWSPAVFYPWSYPRLDIDLKSPPFWNPDNVCLHDHLFQLIPDFNCCINKQFSNIKPVTFISVNDSLIVYCGMAAGGEWSDTVAMEMLIKSYQFGISVIAFK